MKCFNRIFCISLLAAFGVAHAHEGHDHDEKPVTQQEAAKTADKALIALVKNKELDASWQVKQRQETKTHLVDGAKIWRVSYKKPAGPDGAEKTLYVFIDVAGNYIDSNYTGKLAGE